MDINEPDDDDIAHANQVADEVFACAMDLAYGVSEREQADLSCIHYAMWVSLTHMLACEGWSPEGLAADAAQHVRMQQDEEGAEGAVVN